VLIIADSNSSFSQFGKALSVRHRELDEIELSGNIFTQSRIPVYTSFTLPVHCPSLVKKD